MVAARASLLVLLAILVSMLATSCSGASEAGDSAAAASASTPDGDLTQAEDDTPVAGGLRLADTGT